MPKPKIFGRIIWIVVFLFCPMAAFAQAPTIVSTLPTQNELNVPVSTNISVTFDIDMDETTINDSTFVVNARSTGLHSGMMTYNNGTRTATFDPDEDFDVGEVVTVVLTTSIQSSIGTPMDSSFIWSFTTTVDGGHGTFAIGSVYPAGDGPASVVAVYLNGDDHLDLTVANAFTNDVSVLFSNGDGTFTLDSAYDVGTRPWSICAGDLDGDEDIDLCTANQESGNLSVLLNNGEGTFAAHTTYPCGANPVPIFAADLDGDGDLDLVVTNYASSSNVRINLNNGNGTFVSGATLSAGTNPFSVFAADFDNDGDLDLATANSFSNNVSVFFNNGDATFASDVVYDVYERPRSVFVADLDGDSHLDLVTTHELCDTVSVLLSEGDGTFGSYQGYTVGQNSRFVFAADLYGDGDLDLATANMNSDDVSILPNNGNGVFGWHWDYPAGDGTMSVFAADLDKDGDIDLVTANHNSDDLSILFNGPDLPPTAVIDYINPNPAGVGEIVSFGGHGEDEDGFVIGYEWSSDIDGLLSTDSSFSTDSLSPGLHSIDFRVQDDDSLWSAPATEVLDVGTEYLDQEQTMHTQDVGAWPPNKIAQSFTPTLNKLTRVELIMVKRGNPSGTITISVRGDCQWGEDLTWVSLPAEDMPTSPEWIEFNFPDIQIYPGNKYYIVYHPGSFTQDNTVAWGSTSYNTYTHGEAWLYIGDENRWVTPTSPRDFTFKTYGYDHHPPTSIINHIMPNPAEPGQPVSFSGGGSDINGYIVSYEWTSDIDGLLSSDSSFLKSDLEAGERYVNFRVQDDDSLWSIPRIEVLTVGGCPAFLDQEQTQHDVEYAVEECFLQPYQLSFAQSFKPTVDSLARVELMLNKLGDPPGNVTVSIRSSLSGSDLTSVSVPTEQIPGCYHWIQFDFPDIQATPEQTYYIICHLGSFDVYNTLCLPIGPDGGYSRGAGYYYNGTEWRNWGYGSDLLFKTYGHYSVRGDANQSGFVDPGDVVYFINYLFRDGPAPCPLWLGDCNCDGDVGPGDVVYLINYLFREGAPPECP